MLLVGPLDVLEVNLNHMNSRTSNPMGNWWNDIPNAYQYESNIVMSTGHEPAGCAYSCLCSCIPVHSMPRPTFNKTLKHTQLFLIFLNLGFYPSITRSRALSYPLNLLSQMALRVYPTEWWGARQAKSESHKEGFQIMLRREPTR